MCLSKGVEGPESFPSKNRSVAEAMRVFCRRSLHMKPADEKKSLWLHWGSVMQLSIYIKAHYVWRTPQLFSANLIRGLTLTPCLRVTEDDRRFVGVITNGGTDCGFVCACSFLLFSCWKDFNGKEIDGVDEDLNLDFCDVRVKCKEASGCHFCGTHKTHVWVCHNDYPL